MLEIKSDYRQVMAYQIYCAIGLLVLPFSILAFTKGQYLLAFLPTLTAGLCLINVYAYRRQRRFWILPAFISVCYMLNVWLVVAQLGAVGAFWAFPTILALYWVHERRVAVQLVSIFYVGVCVVAFIVMPMEHMLRVAMTLLTTGLFINLAAVILERQYDDLKKLTITDHLTGAFNRRYMDLELDQMLARYQRQGAVSSMIILDVDHFKTINDRYGHSSGDRVLQDIVQIIQSRLRVSDQVCRSGGEEFVILLPDTGEEQARRLGEELRESIWQSPFLQDAKISVSCGVSALRAGDNRDTWFRRCDEALYRAKHHGRNRVVVVDDLPQPDNVLASA